MQVNKLNELNQRKTRLTLFIKDERSKLVEEKKKPTLDMTICNIQHAKDNKGERRGPTLSMKG